jgi:hypothetical protein
LATNVADFDAPMTLKIRQKLLLLLLSSVALLVILVGVVLSYLSALLYKRDAVQRSADARIGMATR